MNWASLLNKRIYTSLYLSVYRQYSSAANVLLASTRCLRSSISERFRLPSALKHVIAFSIAIGYECSLYFHCKFILAVSCE